MQIVIDTNVVASGIFFGGLPHKLLQLVIGNEISTIVSTEIISEYYETFQHLLKDKNYVPKKDISVASLVDNMTIILPSSNVKVCRDPDDDKFINCAIDGKCKYIVSGDKDLLDIKRFQDIEIMTVRGFMDEYGK